MIYDTIIIGAGPSGLSAAIYLKQANKNVLILEKNVPGGKIIKTKGINNYLGYNEKDSGNLSYNMYKQVVDLGVDIKIESVIDIKDEKNKKVIKCKESEYYSRTILIACGRIEKGLNFIKDELDNISYCVKCDGALYKNKTVMLIGNNDESVNDAIYLKNIVKELIYVNYSDKPVNLPYENINVINEKITKITNENNILKSVIINDKVYNIDALFIENGYTPNIDFISSLNINLENNYIVVDENMKTNIDGIYASGDIIKKNVYQIITAASDGAVAALSIIKYLK